MCSHIYIHRGYETAHSIMMVTAVMWIKEEETNMQMLQSYVHKSEHSIIGKELTDTEV